MFRIERKLRTFASIGFLCVMFGSGGIRAEEARSVDSPAAVTMDRATAGRLLVEEASSRRVAMAERLTRLLEKGDTGIVLVEPFRVAGLSGDICKTEARDVWDGLDDHQELDAIVPSDIRAFKGDFLFDLDGSGLDESEKGEAKQLLADLLGEVSGGPVQGGAPVFRAFWVVSYDTGPSTLVFTKSISYLVVDVLSGRGLNVFMVRELAGGVTTN